MNLGGKPMGSSKLMHPVEDYDVGEFIQII
jgi:hypothetical protein